MISTERLQLVPAHPALAQQVVDYYCANRAFLAPFEPERDEDFFTREYWENQLLVEREKSERDEGYRFYICLREAPQVVIGAIALNNVVRGAFQSAHLGYALSEGHRDRGYMTEAILAITQFAFADLNLHRVEANVMPRNGASLRVLEKCGYVSEGSSSRYLLIRGTWEDHIHMVRLNDAWEFDREISDASGVRCEKE